MHLSEMDTNLRRGVHWARGVLLFFQCMCYRLDESRLLTT